MPGEIPWYYEIIEIIKFIDEEVSWHKTKWLKLITENLLTLCTFRILVSKTCN